MAETIEIYDSTLRDGAQSEGIAFSLEDKLLVARRLDELGVVSLDCAAEANKRVHDESLHCRSGLISRRGVAVFRDEHSD